MFGGDIFIGMTFLQGMEYPGIILTDFLLLDHFFGWDLARGEYLLTLPAIAMFFLWFRVVILFSVFEILAFYIMLLDRTLDNSKYFVLLFIIMLLPFANALFILNVNRDFDDDDSTIIVNATGIEYIDSLLH